MPRCVSGSPTLRFTDADRGLEGRATDRLAQPRYLALATALMLRSVFRLALRQTGSLTGSVMALLGLGQPVLNHTTLSRQADMPEICLRLLDAEHRHRLKLPPLDRITGVRFGRSFMLQASNQPGEEIEAAVALAREIAPELEAVIITHYRDEDTLDMMRPGETDLETVRAVNMAVATELDMEGVEVIVQRADRAAFRRWMHGRDDTPENRRGWIDRARLIRGAAALKVLGLEVEDEDGGEEQRRFGPAPGPIADRLLDAYFKDGDEFRGLIQEILEAERTDVLDLAIRKIGESQGEEGMGELSGAMLEVAEAGAVGPSGWSELVALPVALPSAQVPSAAALTESLFATGYFADTDDVRFLPGWRSPDALAELTPVAMRRVLTDLAEHGEPHDLPPGDTDDLARHGFGVLIGLQVDWSIPTWEQIAAVGGLPDEAGIEADGARRRALFQRWRSGAFREHGGCVPLEIIPPSEVRREIADFIEEAGDSPPVVG